MDKPHCQTQQETKNIQAIVEKLRKFVYEGSWFEFKSNLEDPMKIGQYISSLANSAALTGEDYGYLIWGVHDQNHEIIGTSFDHEKIKKGGQSLEPWLASLLNPVPEFHFSYMEFEGKKIAVLEVSAAVGNAVCFSNIAYVRIGSHVKKLHDHPTEEARLYRTLDRTPYEFQPALSGLEPEQAVELLDINSYYELQNLAKQDSFDVVFGHFVGDNLISQQNDGSCSVTNLGALLFARDFRRFKFLERKAPRVIKHKGSSKIEAEREQVGVYGYASGFEGLM